MLRKQQGNTFLDICFRISLQTITLLPMKLLKLKQICPQTEVHLPGFVIVLIERVKIRVKRCSIH